MAAVGVQKRLRGRLAARKPGNQIDDLLLWLLPSAILLALPKARDAANVLHARPVVLGAGGLRGKHVDQAPLDASMCLFEIALKRNQGEKPARRKPLRYFPAGSSDCP